MKHPFLVLFSIITISFALPSPWFIDTRSPPSKRVITNVVAANSTTAAAGSNCTITTVAANGTAVRTTGTMVSLNGTTACLNGTMVAGTNITAATVPAAAKAATKKTRVVRGTTVVLIDEIIGALTGTGTDTTGAATASGTAAVGTAVGTVKVAPATMGTVAAKKRGRWRKKEKEKVRRIHEEEMRALDWMAY